MSIAKFAKHYNLNGEGNNDMELAMKKRGYFKEESSINIESVVEALVLLSDEEMNEVMKRVNEERAKNNGILEQLRKYRDKGYDVLQISEIKLGLEKGLDVSVYDKIEYSFFEMEQIRLGLEKKLDVSIYAKPEFYWKQMSVIRKGLEKELDVSKYADSNLGVYEMMCVKKELEKEKELREGHYDSNLEKDDISL